MKKYAGFISSLVLWGLCLVFGLRAYFIPTANQFSDNNALMTTQEFTAFKEAASNNKVIASSITVEAGGCSPYLVSFQVFTKLDYNFPYGKKTTANSWTPGAHGIGKLWITGAICGFAGLIAMKWWPD